MIIASKKRKENIAEYLLYMWQIEDLIRANNLNIDKICANVIDRFPNLSETQRKEMEQWYESLIDMMHREGIEKSGHLQLNKNTIIHLEDIHRALLADPKFTDYSAAFYKALPFIVELRAKSGENPAGEIETCFNALYGMLMMRLGQKEISAETLEAVKQISGFIALLAHYARLDDENKLFKDSDEDAESPAAQ